MIRYVFNPFSSKFDAIDVATGGGGGTTVHAGIATVDFGAPPDNDVTALVVVTGQSGILATSKITVAKRVEATPDHTADEVFAENWEPVAGSIVPGVGFTIYAKCTVGTTNGRFNISWEWV